jgi:hypothetical protein
MGEGWKRVGQVGQASQVQPNPPGGVGGMGGVGFLSTANLSIATRIRSSIGPWLMVGGHGQLSDPTLFQLLCCAL